MKKTGVILSVIATGLLLGTTAAQGDGPPKPDTVWPVSWVSLVTSILLVCDLVARGFGVYKVGAGAIKKELKEQTDHFDEKMAQVEARLEQKFNGFTSNSELRMNGFGGRLSEVESDQIGANAKITGVEIRMASSEMDRDHIKKSIEKIESQSSAILRILLERPR